MLVSRCRGWAADPPPRSSIDRDLMRGASGPLARVGRCPLPVGDPRGSTARLHTARLHAACSRDEGVQVFGRVPYSWTRRSAMQIEREQMPRLVLAATGVRPTAVVRLGAASLDLAAFCLGHRPGRLAAGHDRPAGAHRCQPMIHGPFLITSPSWCSGPLRSLRDHRERRCGLRPAPGPYGALLRCRSIHTFGMGVPIAVIALDAAGAVIGARVVRPRRIALFPRAAWVVEAPVRSLPAVGESTVATPILAGWPAP